MTRYCWVASRKAEGFSTTAACRVAGVTRQGFYGWCARQGTGPSAKEAADVELVDAIKQVHADSGGVYGSPRVTAALRRRGRVVNHKRVERLMGVHGICGIYKRRRPRWRASVGVRQAPPDLVRRDFHAGQPDRVWAGDITYIATAQGWLYLAVVLDVGSRRVIGYSMNTHMAAELVIDAVDTAAATRGGRCAGVIFHSDRGPQGGLNRWLQHLDDGGVGDGDDEGATGGGSAVSGADPLAGPADGRLATGPGGFLGGDRTGRKDRRCCRRGRRVIARWLPVVPPRWRCEPMSLSDCVGPLSVVL